ncbi:hypothetical protein N7530_007022 [Penicillium desertorum]|uniref:Uncharacterized protein n=1 Tax=Penicillium desertorum TaxID=1303715 RepID=A0A9W9WT32_9EURO|nr:hypothetical protein N7530_007022 [Penicillium desertorum]
MGPLSGKVAIVTGASMGISKGSVERLTADGTLVIVNYNSESAAADEMVYSIDVNRALAVQADVGTMTGVDDLISATVERFGKIDILLLSAGIQFYAQFNSSVQGAFFLVQHTVYVMTKGAVEQATRSLCKALGLKGITVNTIAPEATATDLLLVGKRDEALSGIAALR